MSDWMYEAHFVRATDGDSGELVVDCGFFISHTIKYRLARIDTPEIRGKTLEERNRGKAARQFVEEFFLKNGRACVVETRKTEKWQRWLAEIWIQTTLGRVNLSDLLVAQGHAQPYVESRE